MIVRATAPMTRAFSAREENKKVPNVKTVTNIANEKLQSRGRNRAVAALRNFWTEFVNSSVLSDGRVLPLENKFSHRARRRVHKLSRKITDNLSVRERALIP